MAKSEKNKSINQKPKETRATEAEVENRVSMVVEMILQGYDRRKIAAYAKSKWNISLSATDGYIGKAKVIIKEIASQDSEMEMEKAKARLNDLYQKSYKNQDFRECRNIQVEINKLSGIYAPVKTAQTDKNGEDVVRTIEIVDKTGLFS